MSDLPENWITTEIGGLCSLKNGRAFKPSEWQTSGLPIVRIQNLNNPASVFNYFQGEVDERNRLRGGELLFAWSGTPGTSFGAHVWRGGDAVLNQHIFRVDFDEALLDKRFFRSAINQKLSELIDVAHGGVGLRHVTKGVFEKTLVALPPRPEQTRIANQLDTLLTRVQACNDRFDAIPALLKRFRNSVLAAAVSGRLTGDLRSEDSITSNSTTSSLWRIPASWRWLRADEVTGFITKGTTPSKEKMTSGSGEIPYIKVYNLGFDGRLDFSVDPTFVESITHSVDLKRSITLPGDVLMNIVGPPLGKVAIVPDSHQEWNINQAIARFRPVQGLLSPYLAHCLMSTELISYAVSQAKATVGQLNLTLEICRALPIPMPPEKEQTEIVRRVEALFALADRIEARCTAARTQAQRLSPLVLAKAFRGELVPQDPNDEPASALLARIASSNTAVAGKNKRKVPVARKGRAQAAINL